VLTPQTLSLTLAWALLIAAVLAARMAAARLLIGMAALVWLVRALVWTHDRVAMTGAVVLFVVCLALLARNLYDRRAVSFTADERAMLDSLVTGLSQSRARHLIDQGVWLTGKAGDVLTREGEPVEQLYWLAEGEARVTSGGREVGRCHAGDLVGELTVLSGETASATVTLLGPARFWCAPADMLRPYVDAHEDIRRAIEHGFAMALKAKLRASNRAIAEAGGST
jgi:hypothetical protein